ncbi:hypothetical protein EVAR_68501_1 [Eumeta japonica]|uniref:Uncharacterized protein n=1 Tax=Eumeta variegata TaxID=151549 RepID=A0A4C2A5X4_EUMVA|nr:hypothetical protein EVAR_68501_1 [Eumeta japonica]
MGKCVLCQSDRSACGERGAGSEAAAVGRRRRPGAAGGAGAPPPPRPARTCRRRCHQSTAKRRFGDTRSRSRLCRYLRCREPSGSTTATAVRRPRAPPPAAEGRGCGRLRRGPSIPPAHSAAAQVRVHSDAPCAPAADAGRTPPSTTPAPAPAAAALAAPAAPTSAPPGPRPRPRPRSRPRRTQPACQTSSAAAREHGKCTDSQRHYRSCTPQHHIMPYSFRNKTNLANIESVFIYKPMLSGERRRGGRESAAMTELRLK